ncbi:hypothetical protein BZA77DRAFT_26048 [Pyronema omphalodes]|nr:hypothetical protein BZA77DRAFT_26048 [Pyronema omphalodes]
MATIKSSRNPFPKGPFFFIRGLQLICCAVVLGILAFFQYHLWNDGYKMPYEFSLLDFCASATLLHILLTSLLLFCTRLSPMYLIILDSLLLILWSVGLGLLIRALGRSLNASCTILLWGNDSGVQVCQLFKALVAFVFLSTFMTLCMVINAVVVRKRIAELQYAYERTENPVTEYKGAGNDAGAGAGAGFGSGVGDGFGAGEAQTRLRDSEAFAAPSTQAAYMSQNNQQGQQGGNVYAGTQWGGPYAGQNEYNQQQGYSQQTQTQQQQGYRLQQGQVYQQGGYS